MVIITCQSIAIEKCYNIYVATFAKSENDLISLLHYRYYVKIASTFSKYYLCTCGTEILINRTKTRIVSARSFARCLPPRGTINLSFTTTDDRNGSTCLWPPVARLASYSAADPRNDFSVCRAGTRTRKPYGWSPLGLHDFAPRTL